MSPHHSLSSVGTGLEKQTKRKAEGAKYCDCASCAAASEVLAKFGRMEL